MREENEVRVRSLERESEKLIKQEDERFKAYKIRIAAIEKEREEAMLPGGRIAEKRTGQEGPKN